MKRRGGIASQNFHNATIIFNIFTYFIIVIMMNNLLLVLKPELSIIVIMILTITN